MSKRLRKLRRENKRALEPLSTASTVLIDNITDYIRSAPVRPFNQELARRDMIRMLADAEARGEPPEAVIGADYRLMCDEIISAFPPPSGGILLNPLQFTPFGQICQSSCHRRGWFGMTCRITVRQPVSKPVPAVPLPAG